jgi:hypothetical protein
MRGWLAVIDSRTARLTTMVPTPAESSGQAVVDTNGTWVTESLAGVGFLAPAGGRLAIRPISDARQDVAVSGVAVGGGLVWAYGSFFSPASSPGQNETGVVTAIDPRTGTIVRQLRLAGTDDSFAYGNGALYAADFESGPVLRITPDFKVQALPATKGSESLVAATGGALWATTESGRLLRIIIGPGGGSGAWGGAVLTRARSLTSHPPHPPRRPRRLPHARYSMCHSTP